MSLARGTLALAFVVGVLGCDRAAADAIFGVAPFCPFDFAHGMPPGMFCVYDGVAMTADGGACSDRVQVIWTRLAQASLGDVPQSARDRSVYFGFVAVSELVIRARSDDAAGHRAEIADVTLPGNPTPMRLRGSATSRRVADGSPSGTQVLGLRVGRPVPLNRECAMTSFNGTFVGVMTLLPDSLE